MSDDRTLLELRRSESLRLLASVPVGRLVFTRQALPAIRPVNHIVDGDKIVIGLTPGSAISAATEHSGTVVAYEADSLDLETRQGWTVIVVGMARLESEAAARRYRTELQPWLAGAMTDIISVSSEIVTGYRLVPQSPASEVVRSGK
jgi:nitroimidazol reductase NimA-like FMN-containing flavoprotein (pyridoxamine 5'-phosphate oxidase superfamily)